MKKTIVFDIKRETDKKLISKFPIVKKLRKIAPKTKVGYLTSDEQYSVSIPNTSTPIGILNGNLLLDKHGKVIPGYMERSLLSIESKEHGRMNLMNVADLAALLKKSQKDAQVADHRLKCAKFFEKIFE